MGVIPPKYVRENARRALKALEDGSDAMLRVGRVRARQLASGKPISENTLRRISNFRRHESNASYAGDWREDRGAVAWLGWGNSISKGKGIPDASDWAKRELEKLREED